MENNHIVKLLIDHNIINFSKPGVQILLAVFMRLKDIFPGDKIQVLKIFIDLHIFQENS